MRKILIFLLIFSGLININCYSHSIISGLNKSKDGGGGWPWNISLCYSGTNQTIEIKIVPDHFPFQIKNVRLSNASNQGMNIYFQEGSIFTDIKIKDPNSMLFFENQIIDQNSQLLDKNGQLTISFDYKARFCINSLEYNHHDLNQTFFIYSITEIEDFNPQNGNSLGIETNNRVIPTNILRNSNGNLPYELILPGGGSPVSKEADKFNFKFSAYPNPTKNNLLINFKIYEVTNLDIKVYNSVGKVVIESHEKKYAS